MGTPYEGLIAPEDGAPLIDLAERQAVVGLVIDTLIKNNAHLNRQLVFQIYGRLEQIKQENSQMNKERGVFAQLMATTKDALAKTQLGAWEYDIIAPFYKCNPVERTSVHYSSVRQDYGKA